MTPSFGFPCGKAIFCGSHHNNELHERVYAKKCQKCNRYASYGTVTPYKKLFCSNHRGKSHINLLMKKCRVIGCSIGASFGKEGSPFTHCFKHKEKDDIGLSNRRCISYSLDCE